MMHFIRRLNTISRDDIALVGGKNASLGYMTQHLAAAGVRVPEGFAVTVAGFEAFMRHNGLSEIISKALEPLHTKSSLAEVQSCGAFIRKLILEGEVPTALRDELGEAYTSLGKKGALIPVAVRSSATAEDREDASFAGLHESFLHVTGVDEVVKAYKECLASLFTDRALIYRQEKGIDHASVAMSVVVQQLVRASKAASGVMFTLDTETGFSQVVVISASYGVGESVVKGEVVPDEFHIFKETSSKGYDPIIKRVCGSKQTKRVFVKDKQGTQISAVSRKDQEQFSLSDLQVRELGSVACQLEDHYSAAAGHPVALDIEWAYDEKSGELFILQARPETVHSRKKAGMVTVTYRLTDSTGPLLARGQGVGQKIVVGRARIITGIEEMARVEEGDILIASMTDPDWVPVMKKSAGIITENGGRTCHAAIVSRELGIPALVGAAGALNAIQDGQIITLDCSSGSEGLVYEGKRDFTKEEIVLDALPEVPVKVLLNIASPERAYTYQALPVDGVGLARLEFIITNEVKVHPMALAVHERVTDAKVRAHVKHITAAYETPQQFFIKKVAEGVATIAAAFYPRSVLVRFSDFKSNEYRGLIGGSQFEPIEENPMIGLRGAARYYHELYAPAFELECQAIRYVRESMGLYNVNVMVPFVRTITEAERVVELLKQQGLVSGRSGLEIYMMCEIPSNVILIEQFAKSFDGFSIGSNDLTQTTLSVDRDSGLLASIFDERDPAVTKMLSLAVHGAHYAGKPIGICGQAPSDYPEVAQFLIEQGINSISLNPDSVIPFLRRFGSKPVAEKKVVDKNIIIPARQV